MKDIIDELTYKIAMVRADRIEKYMEDTLPKWYVKFVKRGGVFKWIATKIVKVYIIEKS